MIEAKNGNIITAKNTLQKLSETVKNNDFLYYAMAKIYKEFPLYNEAIECLQNALNIKPQSLEYLSELADCYCETGQFQTAQDIATKVLYLNKHFIYAHLLQAKINIKQKRYNEALKIINNAIKLDNSCAEAYKYQAEVFAAQGLKNRSIESAKIAVSLQPQVMNITLFLQNCYSMHRNTKTHSCITKKHQCLMNLMLIIYITQHWQQIKLTTILMRQITILTL